MWNKPSFSPESSFDKEVRLSPIPQESKDPLAHLYQKKFSSVPYNTDFSVLMNRWNAEKLPVFETSREKLENLGKNIENISVTPENFSEIKKRLETLLAGPEGIYRNIDLQTGDRFIWNGESKSLVILNKQGDLRFGIRFTAETATEREESVALAKIEQNREGVEKPGKILGDWIVKRGAYPGKKNSCGASCGELLNQFGFSKILPQSGRDGKNWDTILEKYASKYFDKIPVWHPDDAPAGSILVFDGNAKIGTSARKKFGHVEIKGSNGRYYSYYSSVNPGGSSRTSEKNPEKYKNLTGFTGYAYVYNGKKPQ